MSVRCHISIHDVMPSTLRETDRALAFLGERGVNKVTLLVVPGLDWSTDDISRLSEYQDAGHRLAGHGWKHKARNIRGLRHRLHSLLLSRDVAEHLSLKTGDIAALIRRCHAWFESNGLNAPDLYVPPAWAMGKIAHSDLYALPFRYYETLGGVYDAARNRYSKSPCTGYEADTAWRAPILRTWNAWCVFRAERKRRLRISIHPYDLDLRLADDLGNHVARFGSHQQQHPV